MKRLVVIAGALVLVGTLAIAGLAYAQTPTPPGGAEDGPLFGGLGRGWLGDDDGLPAGVRDVVKDAIAKGLGLTREELDSRLAAGERLPEIAEAQGLSRAELAQVLADAHEAGVAEALAQGLITQEQADRMLERGFGRGFRMGWRAGAADALGGGGALRDLMRDAVADALGLTRAELDSRLAAGERLPEIAEAQGLSRAELAQALADAHEAAVAEALAQGLITQEQADHMLERGFGMGGRFFGPCEPDTPTPAPETETGLSA